MRAIDAFETGKQYPRVERVIVSFVSRGKGTEKSPCRQVLQVHNFDGTLMAENDPFPEQENHEEKRNESY